METKAEARFFSGKWYEVWRKDGWTKLPRKYDTPEQAWRAGRRHKKKYEYQEPYVVVEVEWHRKEDEEGNFVERRESARVVTVEGEGEI